MKWKVIIHSCLKPPTRNGNVTVELMEKTMKISCEIIPCSKNEKMMHLGNMWTGGTIQSSCKTPIFCCKTMYRGCISPMMSISNSFGFRSSIFPFMARCQSLNLHIRPIFNKDFDKNTISQWIQTRWLTCNLRYAKN